ncbi:ADP-ribosylation/Crystallin J1 [Apodospora peruviana]|uniref:ADP-ribosylhydrolase ARH3 n=1 Tax=Apodospora peruviana TaxID=516989 RepID=A0AAE0LY54_9PEZI|nr:ADP-ribosylation/Crystallin J1 [Apodospora peruviana]
MPDPSTGPTRQERILGALLGVHAGDSLGATVEFASWETIQKEYPNGGVRDIVGGGPFGWPAGHATDDTDLTRAVLLAYRDVARQCNPSESSNTSPPDVVKLAADYMLDWYAGRNWPDRVPGETPRDVGGATATGLRRYRASGDPRKAGAGEGSAGNGSLMRCIPTALFASPSAEPSESWAISAITHDDPLCTISCTAYNAISRALVDGRTPLEALEAGKRATKSLTSEDGVSLTWAAPSRKVSAALEAGKVLVRVDDLAQNGPLAAAGAREALPFKGQGYVTESLTIAVAALLDPRPLEEVLIDVVRIGNDTDTNAAIAGGLLGARDGVNAIPLRWREKLQFRKEFEDIVDELLSSEQPPVQ